MCRHYCLLSLLRLLRIEQLCDDCYREIALLSYPPICVSLLKKAQVRKSQPDVAPVHHSLSPGSQL